MSTNTKSKTKNRWPAVALAALMIAGSVAVPQAADAAAKSSSCGRGTWYSQSCQVKIKAPHGVISFRATASAPRGTKMPWNVKTSSGKTVCKGTTTSGAWRSCSFAYRGTVTLTVSTGLSSIANVSAFT